MSLCSLSGKSKVTDGAKKTPTQQKLPDKKEGSTGAVKKPASSSSSDSSSDSEEEKQLAKQVLLGLCVCNDRILGSKKNKC